MSQSLDKRDRYRPVKHKLLQVGDIVLLVEPFTKQTNYPMAIVYEVETNSIGEVTAAVVFKGKTREKVYRHATSLIRLLSAGVKVEESLQTVNVDFANSRRPVRKAAKKSRDLTKKLF